jgi:hypothetical protein
MQRNQCEEGLGLDKAYMEKTQIWISAEADKRVAIGVNRAVGVNEWHDIARRADDAKTGTTWRLGNISITRLIAPGVELVRFNRSFAWTGTPKPGL